MSFQASVVQIMIASPSDINEERKIIREIIHEWNSVNARYHETILLPVGWETDSTPELGVSGQDVINEQLLKNSDILVAVFWTRIGTPTRKERSGTVEEIMEHYEAQKPTLIYFSKTPVRPDSVDAEQYEELKKFRKWCEDNGLIHEYLDKEEFRKIFNRHISQTLNKYISTEKEKKTTEIEGQDSTESEALVYPTPMPNEIPSDLMSRKGDPDLSLEAKTLLMEASNDPRGIVMMPRTLGGSRVSTNGQNFVSDNSPRERAKWEGAVVELRSFGYLKPEGYGGEVLSVTSRGYELADWLQSKQ